MIVAPDFFDHWKTKALVDLTQRAESPQWVLRLWAHCQTRKAWKFDLPAVALKAICGVPREIDADQWQAWLFEARFLDGDATSWTVHDWREHNASLVANWRNGGKPKRKPSPSHGEATPKPNGEPHPHGSSDRLDGGDRKDGVEGREGKPTRGARKDRGVLPSEQSESLRVRMLEVNALKNRGDATRWSAKEFAAFTAAGIDDMDAENFAEQIGLMSAYYRASADELREHWRAKPGDDFRRRDVLTLLNNWPGEVDRARAWAHWRQKKSDDDGRGRL